MINTKSSNEDVAAVVARVQAINVAEAKQAELLRDLLPQLASALPASTKIKIGIPGARTSYSSSGSRLIAKRWIWDTDGGGIAGDNYNKYDRKATAHFLRKYPKIIAQLERQVKRQEKRMRKAKPGVGRTGTAPHVD